VQSKLFPSDLESPSIHIAGSEPGDLMLLATRSVLPQVSNDFTSLSILSKYS
jgi:hypothetical protein